MKEKIESAVLEGRIIAIIRGFPADICLRLAEAYAKGGIRLVEVTFNQKSPETWRDTAAAIAAIRERFGGDVLAGAGTVLTEEQLAICIESGGEYMITPNVNVALIRSC
ncbi:MAG: 2-dehydro-3-deoxyphosphogluconate aldolase, partial [Kiritimatiellae bacterium]|nr:2-dehydro-3-deoxyphosphogluconate aldolase [Kiritimatiellia bacterium]